MLNPRQSAFREEPFFDEQIAFYVRAWQQLGTCRSFGMAVGPIPWTAIEQWCDAEDVDDDTRELVHGVIGYLDGERAEREQAKAKLAEAEAKRKQQQRRHS